MTYFRPLLGWLFMLGGWLLVLAGIYGFLIALSFLTDTPARFTQAVVSTVISIFIFRGGIQILKVAVAARVCLQAHYDAEKIKQRPLRTRPSATSPPTADW